MKNTRIIAARIMVTKQNPKNKGIFMLLKSNMNDFCMRLPVIVLRRLNYLLETSSTVPLL